MRMNIIFTLYMTESVKDCINMVFVVARSIKMEHLPAPMSKSDYSTGW